MWTGQQGNLLLARDPSLLPVSALHDLPYLPAKSHARSKCPSSVRRRYWPSKFRPRGDQGAQKHVSTTDPRIRGARFKGRSLKCDRRIGIERQQSRKELARSPLTYTVYRRAWRFSINSPAQFLSSLPGHSTRGANLRGSRIRVLGN